MRKRKELDSEIDLVAFISLLSVCICFLLSTAIWIQVGSMNVKQAVGGAPADNAEKIPSVWVLVQTDGSVVLQLQDASRAVQNKVGRLKIAAEEGKYSEEVLREQIIALRAEIPELKMALIKPQAKTLYEDLVAMMDVFKEEGLTELGVAPL